MFFNTQSHFLGMTIIAFMAFYVFSIILCYGLISIVMNRTQTKTKNNTVDPFIGLPNTNVAIISYSATFLLGIGNCKVCVNPNQEGNSGNIVIILMCIVRALLILGFPIYIFDKLSNRTTDDLQEWASNLMITTKDNLLTTPASFYSYAVQKMGYSNKDLDPDLELGQSTFEYSYPETLVPDRPSGDAARAPASLT